MGPPAADLATQVVANLQLALGFRQGLDELERIFALRQVKNLAVHHLGALQPPHGSGGRAWLSQQASSRPRAAPSPKKGQHTNTGE